MLIGQFWGTCAAEGTPAPYCRCPVCTEAREKGGRCVRMRSCFRLSDRIMLDLGADAVAQSMKYGDIADVEHVLVTHTHDDHLNPHMLMEAFWSRETRKPIHYYFTDEAYRIVDCWMNNSWILKGMLPSWVEEGIVVFHQLRYGEPVRIDDVTVTPFRGNHKGNVEPNSAMYLVELPDGRTLFYGLDSAFWLPETIEALKNRPVDIFISEATGGVASSVCVDRPVPPPPGHMSIFDVRELTDILYANGTIHDGTQIYLTHINHHTSHGRMVEAAEKLQFPVPTAVAWDGLKIL